MSDAIRVVRINDLEPSWTVLRAREPGFMRSLVTWMGGPEGYINTNPGVAIESRSCAVGLMDMGPGQRQPGVHTHSMVEIYIILDGMVESFDGVGHSHTAGPLDCLYIPKGVPHGVRTIGNKPVKLLWVNDAIEKWGVSLYQEGPGPHEAENGQTVALIPFIDLEPNWSADRAKEAGFLRWCVTWVGSADHATGPNFNCANSACNERVGISLIVVLPANRLPQTESTTGNHLFVVASGRAVLFDGEKHVQIHQHDAVFCPSGAQLDLRALDGAPLYILAIQTA
ncbi:MAG: cupin domain-containing protein [Hyphomicrobiaceae bacterium]